MSPSARSSSRSAAARPSVSDVEAGHDQHREGPGIPQIGVDNPYLVE